MAGTNLVKTLTRKYAQLVGEYEFAERPSEDAIGLDSIIEATIHCDAHKKEINDKLAAIETVIWMFDPSWNPATVRPNYPKTRYDRPGAISRAAYAILGEAPRPLTTREIAKLVVTRLNIENPVERDVARIESAVHGSLSGREGKTIQAVSRNPIRWALIPRENVKAGRRKQSKPPPKIGIVIPNPAAASIPASRRASSETV